MQAGGASDEYMVRAGDLNASFIGVAFGYIRPGGGTVFGRVAAILVERGQTTVVLSGVPGGHELSELVLNDSDPVHFSQSSALQQIELYVADIAKNSH